jgi:fibronectin-binding autotransporter adhesin
MKNRPNISLKYPIAVFVSLSCCGSLLGGNIIWDADTSGTGTDWATVVNWVGDVAPANNISTDNAIFTTLTAGQPVVTGARSVAGIELQTVTGGWTLGGTGTLTLGDKGIDAQLLESGTNTISVANIVMGSSTASTWQMGVTSAATSSITSISSNIQLHETAQLQIQSQRASGSVGTGTINLTGIISNTTGKATSGQMKYLGGSAGKNTFNVSGLNTYTGNTLISQAVVNFNTLANSGSSSALGSAGTINIVENTSFGTLNYNGTTAGTTNRRVTIGATFVGITGQANIDNSATGAANAISFTATDSIIAGGSGNRTLGLRGTNTGNNSFAQLIENATSGVTSLRKEGGGKWIISNNSNTYTGETGLIGGTLEVASLADIGTSSALGSDGIIRFNGGSLTYTGGTASSNRSLTVGPSTGTGSVNATLRSSGSGALTLNAASMAYGTVNEARSLTLGGTNIGNNTFATPIANNGTAATALTKADGGKWILSGTSTYTGATSVSAGTLLVNGSLGNTVVTVASGATLGGSGTIGTNTVTNTVTVNGTLAPGNSPGILAIEDNLSLNGILAMEITGLTAGNGSGFHDQVILNGAGTFGGTLNLSWNLSTAAPVNTELLLILNDGADPFSGAFSNAANLSQHTDNLGNSWKLLYAGGSGNDLTLVAVPEPDVAALLGGLGALALLRRRR